MGVVQPASGAFLYVANGPSDNISIYSVETGTGLPMGWEDTIEHSTESSQPYSQVRGRATQLPARFLQL